MRKSSKLILVAGAIAALAVPSAAMATPTVDLGGGPGAWGNYRAGTVQAVNDTNGGIYGMDWKNAGADVFSVRKGENSTINHAEQARSAALSASVAR